MVKPRTILERLDADEVIIGDGGFVFALEKRGYVKAGPWTPEATVEHPEAVLQLHREFLRAGADVMQAFTFYASDDKLCNRGNDSKDRLTGPKINEAACELARKAASESEYGLMCGGLSQTPTYLSTRDKGLVQAEFKKQVDVFIQNKADFILAEYFEHVEECEWAIEVCKSANMPIAASMCIGPDGDLHGVSTEDCGERLAKAGAQIVGLNCHFDPFVSLEGMKKIKAGVERTGLKIHLMVQPLAFLTPDAQRQGFIDLPEFPFALEPRICTRFDMHRFARESYEMGIRYIGGCCGFEPYHIRAVAEELQNERGRLPEGSVKHVTWGGGLMMHTKPWVRARARKTYWENLNPSSGRPFSAAQSKPDAWGVTAGDEKLKQKTQQTTVEEIEELIQQKKPTEHQPAIAEDNGEIYVNGIK